MEHADTRLSSSEIATLWVEYMNQNMDICFMRYFKEKADDQELKNIIDHFDGAARKSITAIATLFAKEGWPVPAGFTADDVDASAPRLFSDTVALKYIKNRTKNLMSTSAAGLAITAQPEVRSFFRDSMSEMVKVDEEVTRMLLHKGLFLRSPYIPVPDKVEFAQNKGFLGSIFGSGRSLHAVEISNLFLNLQENDMAKTLLTGFSQVAKSQRIREYFYRGKEIAGKHIEVLRDKLAKEDLSASTSWDLTVTNSTVAPFSDKLMMFTLTVMNGMKFGMYGLAAAANTRSDLVADYTRLMAELALYAEDGAQIAIENGWMEIPPRAVERRELVLQR